MKNDNLPVIPFSYWYLRPQDWTKATSTSVLLCTYFTIWGKRASSSFYMGTVTTLLYFKVLTGFSVCKSIFALTTFTMNNICQGGENCWDRKSFIDINGMIGILPGSITIFWFGVDMASVVHGWSNTRKESSLSKPSKLKLPSCGNSFIKVFFDVHWWWIWLKRNMKQRYLLTRFRLT